MTVDRKALRGALVPLAAALACIFGSVAVAAPSEHVRATRAAQTPDVTALFERAVKRVRRARDGEFRRAVMLEANGKPADRRPVRRAVDIVRWRFVLNTGGDGSDFLSATISYGPPPKRFGKVVGYQSPFLGDNAMSKPPKMTLREAVSLLRGAGYRKPFFNVTLRDPVGPTSTPPLYIFTLGDRDWVAVNTKTGKVKPIR